VAEGGWTRKGRCRRRERDPKREIGGERLAGRDPGMETQRDTEEASEGSWRKTGEGPGSDG